MTNHDVSGSTTPNRLAELEAQLVKAEAYMDEKANEANTAQLNYKAAYRNVEDLKGRIHLTKLLASGESLAAYAPRD